MSEKRTTKETILNTLRTQKDKLRREYRVKTIGLFGSYVTGKQKENSDIDFLVEFESDAD